MMSNKRKIQYFQNCFALYVITWSGLPALNIYFISQAKHNNVCLYGASQPMYYSVFFPF